jgi:hypothetical protein
MQATTAHLSDHSAPEKPKSGIFGRLWRKTLVLVGLAVVLAVEVGWVALLGYGLVFLFS